MKKTKQMMKKLLLMTVVFSLYASPALAAMPDADSPGGILWTIIKFVFDLVAPILIFFGAYKIAFGFGNNKPEEQTKGVQMAVSGVMIKAIVTATDLFGGNLFDGATGGWNNLDNAITMLTAWVSGLGVALLGYGLIKMAMAFQNDDVGGRTKSFQQVVTGGILVGIGPLVNAFIDGDPNALDKLSVGTDIDVVGALFSGAFAFIGGAMVLFGAIHLAQAFAKEDAEAKMPGLRWMVAGTLVIALGAWAPELLPL